MGTWACDRVLAPVPVRSGLGGAGEGSWSPYDRLPGAGLRLLVCGSPHVPSTAGLGQAASIKASCSRSASGTQRSSSATLPQSAT